MGGVLVQRIRKRLPDDAVNIDARFRFEHMGFAEFEDGILGASFRLMRSRPCGVMQVQPGGLWFVGDPADIKDAREFYKSQVKSDAPREFRGERLKVQTWLRSCMEERRDPTTEPLAIGWWWLAQDGWPESSRASEPVWCLFLREEDAMAWAECCVQVPAT